MLQFPVVIQRTTMRAISEHSTGMLGGAVFLNESEAVVLLDREVIEEILRRARPDDQRIDDVIRRLVL